VLEKGQRASRDGLVAVAMVNSLPGEPSKLGLAVRCRRGAVARNRVKRRIRAAFRQLRPVGGYDVVVRANDRVLDTKYSRLVEDLGAALDRVTGSGT
jgi:ribonuclease P protein component